MNIKDKYYNNIYNNINFLTEFFRWNYLLLYQLYSLITEKIDLFLNFFSLRVYSQEVSCQVPGTLKDFCLVKLSKCLDYSTHYFVYVFANQFHSLNFFFLPVNLIHLTSRHEEWYWIHHYLSVLLSILYSIVKHFSISIYFSCQFMLFA